MTKGAQISYKKYTIIPNKYTEARMAAIQNLISSKIRIEILRILALSPQSSFNINELSRYTGFSVRGVEKELKNLHAGGILRREIAGNQHRYQFEGECPIGGEIRGLIVKTVGVAEVVKHALSPSAEQIEHAFIYGSFATGEYSNESDVGLFLVTEVDCPGSGGVCGRMPPEIMRPQMDADHIPSLSDHQPRAPVGEAKDFLFGRSPLLPDMLFEPIGQLLGDKYDLLLLTVLGRRENLSFLVDCLVPWVI